MDKTLSKRLLQRPADTDIRSEYILESQGSNQGFGRAILTASVFVGILRAGVGSLATCGVRCGGLVSLFRVLMRSWSWVDHRFQASKTDPDSRERGNIRAMAKHPTPRQAPAHRQRYGCGFGNLDVPYKANVACLGSCAGVGPVSSLHFSSCCDHIHHHHECFSFSPNSVAHTAGFQRSVQCEECGAVRPCPHAEPDCNFQCLTTLPRQP